MIFLKCTNSPLAIHNLARFLSNILPPLVPNDYSFADTFSFISQIKNANLSKKVLVSYDVTSCFSNIPLQEAIDVALNHILNHNPNLNITKRNLKNFSFLLHYRLVLLLTKKSRVAMDSPLAPVLAKVFMGFYESQWLDEYNLNKPNFFYDMLMTLKLLFTTKKIHEFFKICQIIGILILNL